MKTHRYEKQVPGHHVQVDVTFLKLIDKGGKATRRYQYTAIDDATRADGKLIWRDGVAAVAFGAQAGTSLADLAAHNRGFLEWVLRKDFSDEVKTIVRDALAGRFPVRSETESE